MTLNSFIKLIFKKKQTFIAFFVVFFLLAGLVTIAQPFKYGSSVRLLVVRIGNETVDPYMASRSNEQLSELLARVIHSYTFFDKVLSSSFNIDSQYFSGSKKEQIKKWKKTVTVKTLADTGIIDIKTYYTKKDKTEQLAKAVVYTLQTNHQLYHGYGESVQLREIDTPLTSNYPVKPNVLLVFVASLVFSFLFFLFYVYMFPEEKYDIKIWPNFKNKKVEKVNNNWQSLGDVIKNRYQEELQDEGAEQDEEAEQNEGAGQAEEYSDVGSINNILK